MGKDKTEPQLQNRLKKRLNSWVNDYSSAGADRREADLLALVFATQVQAAIHQDFPVSDSHAQAGAQGRQGNRPAQ